MSDSASACHQVANGRIRFKFQQRLNTFNISGTRAVVQRGVPIGLKHASRNDQRRKFTIPDQFLLVDRFSCEHGTDSTNWVRVKLLLSSNVQRKALGNALKAVQETLNFTGATRRHRASIALGAVHDDCVFPIVCENRVHQVECRTSFD